LCAKKLFTLIKTYRGTTIYGEGFLLASIWKYHPLTCKTSSDGFQNIIHWKAKHHRMTCKTSSKARKSLNVSFTRRNSIIYDA